ncbi:MAG: DUF423 domain-containing protein [Burkholderiales bacterium]|nr:MAG: DUF423 domain-containing protein [Betaproteobacteria bacterium TMED22]|tara:strand:+ start:17208 stop:17600 length:393 start_codon:yes stop_codon:yes gene_type:complete
MILLLAGALGLISVAFGAYSEHGLKQMVTEEEFRFLMTAVRYNQIHAVVTVAIGLGILSGIPSLQTSLIRWSGKLFILGTTLFSFSIYLSVGLDMPELVNVTPFGGTIIMLAWTLLAICGYKSVTQNHDR